MFPTPGMRGLMRAPLAAPFAFKRSFAASSLYERLGGAAAVDVAVDKFYDKILADDSLVKHHFAKTDMTKQRQHQKRFMTQVFGGPKQYSGKNMKAAHAHLKITEADFNFVANTLKTTLEELGVPKAELDEVMATVGSTKGDIVNA